MKITIPAFFFCPVCGDPVLEAHVKDHAEDHIEQSKPLLQWLKDHRAKE